MHPAVAIECSNRVDRRTNQRRTERLRARQFLGLLTRQLRCAYDPAGEERADERREQERGGQRRRELVVRSRRRRDGDLPFATAHFDWHGRGQRRRRQNVRNHHAREHHVRVLHGVAVQLCEVRWQYVDEQARRNDLHHEVPARHPIRV